MSATVVGYGSFVGVALLGTSLQESHKRYLAQFSTAVVALYHDELVKNIMRVKNIRANKCNLGEQNIKEEQKI